MFLFFDLNTGFLSVLQPDEVDTSDDDSSDETADQHKGILTLNKPVNKDLILVLDGFKEQVVSKQKKMRDMNIVLKVLKLLIEKWWTGNGHFNSGEDR